MVYNSLMRKPLIALFVAFLCPTLSSCTNDANKIIAINTTHCEIRSIDLTYDQLCNLIDSKQQLLLNCYSPYCSSCERLDFLLYSYTTASKKFIYKFNYFDNYAPEGKTPLPEKYPTIFYNTSLPKLSFIQDNKLTYDVNQTKFESYTVLSNIIRKRIIDSSIQMIDSINGYKWCLDDMGSNCLLYFYDVNNPLSLTLASDYLITKEKHTYKKNIILANIRQFSDIFADFKDFISADTDTFAAVIKDRNIIKTTDYSLDGGIELQSMISNL